MWRKASGSIQLWPFYLPLPQQRFPRAGLCSGPLGNASLRPVDAGWDKPRCCNAANFRPPTNAEVRAKMREIAVAYERLAQRVEQREPRKET
jgi:hypothetical protein